MVPCPNQTSLIPHSLTPRKRQPSSLRGKDEQRKRARDGRGIRRQRRRRVNYSREAKSSPHHNRYYCRDKIISRGREKRSVVESVLRENWRPEKNEEELPSREQTVDRTYRIPNHPALSLAPPYAFCPVTVHVYARDCRFRVTVSPLLPQLRSHLCVLLEPSRGPHLVARSHPCLEALPGLRFDSTLATTRPRTTSCPPFGPISRGFCHGKEPSLRRSSSLIQL